MENESRPSSLIGQEIDGYFVETLLGQGGMAQVYRGYDVRLERYVAIKVIKPLMRANQKYMLRFEKEARAIAQLNHPHIVNIYRFGEVNDLYYMVMQFIEGVDLGWILNDYSANSELLPYEDVARIISQMADALDYAHANGVIHRDVKPSNIMLNRRGDAVLTDFGIALLQNDGTLGEVLGSPSYVAPEQAANSSQASSKSDLYSLGIVLYEMLTGTVPYGHGSTVDIVLAHTNEPLPSPLERNPDLHPAFVPVLEKALQKEPEDRYQSGLDFARALQEAIEASQQTSPDSKISSRISRVTVPDKVSVFQEANPLPSFGSLPTMPFPISTTQTKGAESPAVPEAPPTSTPPSDPVQPPQQRTWQVVGLASVGIVLFGIVAILMLVNSAPPPQNITLEPPPTIEATLAQADTAVPSPLPPTALPSIAAPTIVPEERTPYALLIQKRSADGALLVRNLTTIAFPLAPLRLSNSSAIIQGVAWNIEKLENGDCVSIIPTAGNQQQIEDASCNVVGELRMQSASGDLWQGEFNVYYNEQLIDTCRTETCVITIANET